MKIPTENQEAFERLMKAVPPGLKNDEGFQKTALAYLIVGGESLARHYLGLFSLDFPDVSLLLQHTPLIEPDKEVNEEGAPGEEDDENEDEADSNA